MTTSDQRTSPLIVKKISNSNNRVVVVSQSIATTPTTITTINKPTVSTSTTNQRVGGPSGFIQVRQNLMANTSNTSSNTIDLTDEDDAPKTRNTVNNPPALVALNAARNRSAAVTAIVQTQQAGTRPQVLAPQPQLRNASATNVRKYPVIRKLNKAHLTTRFKYILKLLFSFVHSSQRKCGPSAIDISPKSGITTTTWKNAN